jgi:UDP-glucose 4-epimerase
MIMVALIWLPCTRQYRDTCLHPCVGLAEGHVAALKGLLERGEPFTVNLGNCQGYSVLGVVHTIEKAIGQLVPFQITHYRPGNVSKFRPDPSNAQQILGWCARKSFIDMFADAWRWQ